MKIHSIAMAMSISSIAAATTYQRFEDLMKEFGYDWSAHEVTTSDDYILTIFNIPANKTKDYRGSILIQHSDRDDGTSWIQNHEDAKAFHFLLADMGYNVWIGNSRGTEYSQRHKIYDAAGPTAKEYWDFSWFDMQKDVKANMEEILSLTKEQKLYYVGYSQGTTQMLSAIAGDNEQWYAKHLHRAVMLEPCFYRFYPALLYQWYYEHSLATFRANEIYALYGPNWQQVSEKICREYDAFTCALFTSQTENIQPISVKAEQHWVQNGLRGQFTEFEENWFSNDGSPAPIDVSKISDVPMSFFVGGLDFTCPDGVAQQFIEQMPTYQNEATKTEIIDAALNGYYFFADETNNEWFMENLLAQLAL